MSSPPSDQLTHGSLPPWPPMDFTTSLSFLLQDDPRHHPPSFIPSQLPSSPSPSLNSPHLLSSQASMGVSTAKVSKRKSRAANKPPIRVLSADRASFRDMVQKLTGIPTSPSLQGSGRLWGMSNPSAIFRPMAARPGAGSQSDLPVLQSMPTLDTSSAYLSRGLSSNNLAYNEAGKGRSNVSFDDQSLLQAVKFDPSGYNSTASFESRGGPMFEGWACNDGRMAMDMESLERLQRASELESLLMGNSKLEDLLQGSPWFSGDVLHAPSPKVEIAHSA